MRPRARGGLVLLTGGAVGGLTATVVALAHAAGTTAWLGSWVTPAPSAPLRHSPATRGGASSRAAAAAAEAATGAVAADTSPGSTAVDGRGKPARPQLDYPPPPPAASLAWPRWLSWLTAAVASIQGFRRKLFGGSEAVALDPALPAVVRLELIKSRKDLRARAQRAPRAFRRMLRESADTLEEVPALLVTVAVLVGAALRRSGASLTPFRRMGEAQALLFTAGRLHLGIKDSGSGTMRLLGGDFLYAEGQWILAELGSLPAIKMTARMIREVADGASKGGAAAADHDGSGISSLGARTALHAAFLGIGTYFAVVASGAAWLSDAPPATVEALRRYGASLGSALKLSQYRDDPASQDCALWLARSARESVRSLSVTSNVGTASLRALERLAIRVERACAMSLDRLIRRSAVPNIRGLSFGEFEALREQLEELYRPREGDLAEDHVETALTGLGFTRDEAADRDLQALISSGLSSAPLSATLPPMPLPWPEGGPKAALESALRCVGRELVGVNAMLDGTDLASPAVSELVHESVLRLFATGGKRLRPALVLLVAHALRAPDSGLRRVAALAASVEVLHSASLVHDDILDGAKSRRGEPTAHTLLGERAATLVGDFLFATASCLVAELGSLPAVLLISKVVADFGRGELAQSAVRFEAVDYSLEDYLAKSFYKTASLLAAACHAAAVLSGASPSSTQAQSCYRFGAYVGLAFQVVDDILDFTSTEEQLGKPALADLREGNLSAPVLFAAQASGEGAHQERRLKPEARAELLVALERRLSHEGDLDRVIALVDEAGGVDRAKALARRFVDLASAELLVLPEGEARGGLQVFAEFVVARTS